MIVSCMYLQTLVVYLHTLAEGSFADSQFIDHMLLLRGVNVLVDRLRGLSPQTFGCKLVTELVEISLDVNKGSDPSEQAVSSRSCLSARVYTRFIPVLVKNVEVCCQNPAERNCRMSS